MAIYKGFSTVKRAKKFSLSDFDLAKQDLFNHFHIRKGQKLMDPDFGTVIWDMLYEPLTDSTIDIIKQDISQIVNYDPRLEVLNVNCTEIGHGIIVELLLRYKLTNESDVMLINFESRLKP